MSTKELHRAGVVRARVLGLVREKYGGEVDTRFGPTLAAEHLASEDGLTVDHETQRRWMLAAGLWSRARRRSAHRRRRERKALVGELVQMDGSFHPWFEGRGAQSCLLTLVDDATGTSLGRFGAQETIWAASGSCGRGSIGTASRQRPRVCGKRGRGEPPPVRPRRDGTISAADR
jgi:hypothetical protein